MEGIAWVFSIVLAIFFLVVGYFMDYRYEKAKEYFAWISDLPEIIVRILGGLQILGAVGLILPMFSDTYAWLTAIAAGALAMLQLMAMAYNTRRHDFDSVWLNGLLAVMLLVVAYARWTTTPSSWM
jgi:putative oxidoreductase